MIIRKTNFKALLLIFFGLCTIRAQSQDFGVSAINSPATGCNMGNSSVSVAVTNYGSSQTLVTVNLRYQLDGGTIVSQSQLFAVFTANSTQNITFTVPINLSNNFGSHTLVAYTDFTTDVKRSNDTTTLNFFNYQSTKAGTLFSSDTVCLQSNGDTLVLKGKIGDVERWESDNGGGFVQISNKDTIQPYSNLQTTTRYRTLVKNGTCSNLYSNIVTIQVDTPAQAGNLAASKTICIGQPGDTLRLKGYKGKVAYWQKNEGTGWINITNTTDTLIYSSPTKTTNYRVVVSNGKACDVDTSNEVTIKVIPKSEGGNITPAISNVCAYKNSDTLILMNKIGEVTRWELSDDNGNTWIPFVKTDTTHVYKNLAVTRQFRALVQFQSCAATYSSIANVITDPAPSAGILFQDNQVCAGGSIGDTLRLKNYVGTIVKWQSDSGGGWFDIAKTTDTLVYPAPTGSTNYRVIVSEGSCPNDTSNIVNVSVVSATKGGNIMPKNSVVCENDNSGTLTLENRQGNVLQWEISDDNGATWIAAVNKTIQQDYNNLSSTRLYRVLVEANGCPARYSDTAIVEVRKNPIGGRVVEDKSICGGSNRDTLILVEYQGNVLRWQFNNGSGWIDINNIKDTLIVTSILQTTSYRAIVGNGVCVDDTSKIATLTIIATTYGGEIEKSDSVCHGINSGELTLKNHIGDIRWWEVSTDKGVNWTIRSNQSTVQKYLNVDVESWYRVLVEGRNCPNDYSDTAVLIPYYPALKITASDTTSFCFGGEVDLTATLGYSSYKWNVGDSTTTITAKKDGMYTVTITDFRNCKNSDSIRITVYNLPIADAGENATISLGATIQLKASGGVIYHWTPTSSLNDSSIATPLATPWVTTTYKVIVTDVNGCKAEDTVLVTVIKDYNFDGKNLITPNGDGINDTWHVSNILPYTKCKVTIVNRYGDIIFQKTGYDNMWDGTDGSKTVSDGTYYYIITCEESNQVIKGNITVLTK